MSNQNKAGQGRERQVMHGSTTGVGRAGQGRAGQMK